MNFFQRISPFYIPPATAQAGGLAILRERILQTMLVSAAVLGIPMVLGTIDKVFFEPLYRLPGMYIYGPIYILVLITGISRFLPYNIRASIMANILLLMAVSELFETGLLGEVRMLLLVYVVLTSVLFNTANVAASIVISILIIVASGIYGANNPTPPIAVLANLPRGTDWISSTITFLTLSFASSTGISLIIRGLNENLKNQAELAHSLQYERDMLEERVNERTRNMARRMVQLRTSAEISRTISALSDPEGLFQQVVELIRERFDLYYVGVFLLDRSRQYAVLQAGTGEQGKRMLSQGHQLAIGGSSMIGWCIGNRKARVALDVGKEAVRFSNPNLPLTRSELALPIIAHDHVMGAMTVQSERQDAFDENDVSILQSIADSLAIALENDQLYQETRQRLDEIRALNREYLQRAWTETLDTYGELNFEYESPNIVEERGATKSLQVPLVLRDAVIGEITLDLDRGSLTEEEKVFVENITTQTAIALENARLLHETERRAIQEQKLNELATRFSRALNIEEILRAAAQELGQLPAVAEVSVQLTPHTAAGKAPTNPSGFHGNSNGKEHAG